MESPLSDEVFSEEVSLSVDETPSGSVEESGGISEDSSDDSGGSTFTLNEAVNPPSIEVAVITALPSFFAVSVQELPSPFTETTDGLLDDHEQSVLSAKSGEMFTFTLSESPIIIVLLSNPNDISATGTQLVAGSIYWLSSEGLPALLPRGEPLTIFTLVPTQQN